MIKTIFIIIGVLVVFYVLYKMFLKPSPVPSAPRGLYDKRLVGSWIAVDPKNPTKITFYEDGKTEIIFATPAFGGTYASSVEKNLVVYGKNIKADSPYGAVFYLIDDIDSNGQFILSSSGFMNTQVVKVLMKKVSTQT